MFRAVVARGRRDEAVFRAAEPVRPKGRDRARREGPRLRARDGAVQPGRGLLAEASGGAGGQPERAGSGPGGWRPDIVRFDGHLRVSGGCLPAAAVDAAAAGRPCAVQAAGTDGRRDPAAAVATSYRTSVV